MGQHDPANRAAVDRNVRRLECHSKSEGKIDEVQIIGCVCIRKAQAAIRIALPIEKVGIVQGIEHVGEDPGEPERHDDQGCHGFARTRKFHTDRDEQHRADECGNHQQCAPVCIILSGMSPDCACFPIAQGRRQKDEEQDRCQIEPSHDRIVPLPQLDLDPHAEQGKGREKSNETYRGKAITDLAVGGSSHDRVVAFLLRLA